MNAKVDMKTASSADSKPLSDTLNDGKRFQIPPLTPDSRIVESLAIEDRMANLNFENESLSEFIGSNITNDDSKF